MNGSTKAVTGKNASEHRAFKHSIRFINSMIKANPILTELIKS